MKKDQPKSNDNTTDIKGRLILFRHGQTEYNKNKLMTGITDVPLTAEGEEQAREAGRRLRGIPVQRAYSSTLSRAFNTATIALRAAGQVHLENDDGTFRVRQDRDIVELDTGDFTGRCHKTDAEILNWVRHFNKALPNGESEAMVLERVQRFFDREVMPRLEKGETVMVVAHAGIVRVFDYVLGTADIPVTPEAIEAAKRRSVPNATPVLFDFVNGKLVSETMLIDGGQRQHRDITPRQRKFG